MELYLLTGEEQRTFTKDTTYRKNWEGYDWANFRDMEKTSENIDLESIRKLPVDRNMTIAEVISSARKAFSIDHPEFLDDHHEELSVTYSLYYPNQSTQRLADTASLLDLGVTNEEVMFLKRVVHWPPAMNLLASVKDFKDFQNMVLEAGDPDDKRNRYYRNSEIELNAVLLYTDEDEVLATFVRRHYDKLHIQSGKQVMVYVVEEPTRDSAFAASTYWRSTVDKATYFAWSLFGLARSKPYDKSHIYEIARNLGIYPDQLPCTVFFTDIRQSDKIIIPIEENYTQHFRDLFTSTQKAIDEGGRIKTHINRLASSIRLNHLLNENITSADDLFERFRRSVKKKKTSETVDRQTFNFYGKTVFINKPSGKLFLQDIQNDKET